MNEIMRRALADALRPLVEMVRKVETKLAGKPHFEWGTVVNIDPLRVKLDSHATALPDSPEALEVGLAIGDRVRVERQGTRATVHGKGGKTQYTATERETGRVWVDGKPVYERAISGTISQAGGVRNTRAVLAAGTVDTLINAKGMWTGSDGNQYVVSQTSGNDNLGSVYHFSYVMRGSSGVVNLFTRSDGARSNAPFQVVVEYTKL